MDFCIISPAVGLERYATLSRTHLVLAQVQNEQYKEFYRHRKTEGDFIILDNGAYEGLSQFNSYEQSIRFYEPNVVILPDFLHQKWENTYMASKDFLDKFYSEFPQTEWMYVPQTIDRDIFGWIEGCISAINELPINWVGLPRVMQTHYFPEIPNVRAKACRFIKDYTHGKVFIHALGMCNGDVSELKKLEFTGCNSIDSSAPVWRGWNGFNLTDTRDLSMWNTLGNECDFNAQIPEFKQLQVLKNLEVCGVDTSSIR